MLKNKLLILILFLGLIIMALLKSISESPSKVAVFAGSGAVLAEDVEFALKKLNIQFKEIDENEIKGGKLKNFEILIIPGGRTEEILEALREKGFEEIKNFVRDGGKYIGICAGAYLAPEIVKLRWGREKPGLGIIDIENKREAGIELREIEIVNENHPIVKGYKGKVKIWYQNGPFMKPGRHPPTTREVEVIAEYDEDFAAIVASNYGKGKVILFSPHPEGNLENKIDPEEISTLDLLKNAINW